MRAPESGLNMTGNNDNLIAKLDLQVGQASTHALKPILWIVASVSIAMQTILYFSSDLIVTPDSAGYISLAQGLVENLDFRQDHFQFRTPAYPMFLAVVFKIFGKASVVVLPLLQHLMVVGSVLVACLTAYELKPSKSFALIVGLIAASGFHLGAYANAVLTETPYALIASLCVYYSIRYLRRGESRSIILASFAAGLATMFRPVGQGLVVVCIIVALLRLFSRAMHKRSTEKSYPENSVSSRSRRHSLTFDMVMAVIPALLIIGPWMCYKASIYGRFDLTYAGNMAFYQRAIVHDGIDPAGYPSFTPIGQAIKIAQDEGYIDKKLSHLDFYTAMRAHQYVYKSTRSEAAYAVGAVGQEIMLATYTQALSHTPKHAYRTLFMPDTIYRFLPNGSPGTSGKLAKNATLFSAHSYANSVTQRTGHDTMQMYLPLKHSSNRFTKPWESFCRWYRTRIELGKPLLGLLDTPYEEWMALSVIGCVISMIRRDRKLYLPLLYILAFHTVVTSFFGGALPRYIVPINSVLAIFTAIPINLAYEFCTNRSRKQSRVTKRKLSIVPA